jgi:subtilisin-like proprotein convertase family protein
MKGWLKWALASLGCLVGAVSWAAPQTIDLNGALASTSGAPVADGKYPVTFGLYKAEVGGTPVWTEPVAAVQVAGGGFHAVLGAVNPLKPELFAAPLWLEVKIEPDPALTRVPLRGVGYAFRAGVAEALDCSGCVPATALDPAALAPFAKAAELAKVASTGAYGDLSGAPDLSVYAKSAGLAKVALSGAYADLSGGPDLAPYAKAANLSAVAFTGKFADLNGQPTLPKLGASCGTGLVMRGLLADGGYDCVAGFDANSLPANGLQQVSNGTLTNNYTDTLAGKSGLDLPDNSPNGLIDTVVVPDLGTATSLSVSIDLGNSDLSSVTVTLTDPAGGSYVLWNKSGAGTLLKKSYPATPTVSGDLTSWVGKNPKGSWKLTVVDAGFLNNKTDGKLNAWSVQVGTLASKKVAATGMFETQAGLKLMTAASDPVTCDASNLAFVYYNTTAKALYICNGSAFFPIFTSLPGTQSNPALSCADLAAKLPGVGSGVYWIDPDGTGAGFAAAQTFCDQSLLSGGWTMIYKHSPAAPVLSDPVGEIKFAKNVNDASLLGTGNVTKDVSLGWSNFPGAKQLLAVVYKGGKPVYTIGFNLISGDPNATWSKANYVKALSTVDIGGYDASLVTLDMSSCGRYFYVTAAHGGCPNDSGSLVVNGGGGPCCGWEKPQSIQYYPGPNASVNYNAASFLADGESFLLFVK